MMPPPVVLDPIVLAWRCRHSTRCCRGWRIDVSPADLRAMALRCTEAGDFATALRLMAAHASPERLDGCCALPLRPDGSCLFLAGDLCDYRLRHGSASLPASCAKFPYVGLLTPERRLVSLSFACPTALGLLAQAERVELDEQAPEPPPTALLVDFCGTDEEGTRGPARAFWEAHWAWVEFFRGAEGPPAVRLRRLVERAAGAVVPEVGLAEALWALPRWDRGAGAPLLAAGAAEPVLAAVFDESRLAVEPTDLGVEPDDGRLLNRYLDHRLLVPEYLSSGASLERLLGVELALLARYRIERARGRCPADAVAAVDRLVLHSDFVPQLFPGGVSEAQAWRSLALLALAA